MRLAITGSRDGVPSPASLAKAVYVAKAIGATEILHGGATGIGRAVSDYLGALGFPVREFPADWDHWRAQGRPGAAGPVRNRQMIAEADALLAWPGGVGTADCKRHARRKGIPIYLAEGADA